MDIYWGSWTEVAVNVSHLMSTINSSLNFVIYCWKDRKFRACLVDMLSGCCGWGKADGGRRRRRGGSARTTRAATMATTVATGVRDANGNGGCPNR